MESKEKHATYCISLWDTQTGIRTTIIRHFLMADTLKIKPSDSISLVILRLGLLMLVAKSIIKVAIILAMGME